MKLTECLTKISEKQVKGLNLILCFILLCLESFLLVFTCILVNSEKSSQVFIYIIVSSIFAVLTAVCILVFICQPAKFNRKKRILTIFVLLFSVTLASCQLYLAIFLKSLENSLVEEIGKCEKSEVFADVFWSYQRIYEECGSFAGCYCVEDTGCSVELVRVFYELFECDGICGLGNKACDRVLAEAISEKSTIFCASLISAFVVFVVCAGLVCWAVKLQISAASPLQVPERTISNLEGITINFDSQLPNRQELADISSIPRIDFDDISYSLN